MCSAWKFYPRRWNLSWRAEWRPWYIGRDIKIAHSCRKTCSPFKSFLFEDQSQEDEKSLILEALSKYVKNKEDHQPFKSFLNASSPRTLEGGQGQVLLQRCSRGQIDMWTNARKIRLKIAMVNIKKTACSLECIPSQRGPIMKNSLSTTKKLVEESVVVTCQFQK